MNLSPILCFVVGFIYPVLVVVICTFPSYTFKRLDDAVNYIYSFIENEFITHVIVLLIYILILMVFWIISFIILIFDKKGVVLSALYINAKSIIFTCIFWACNACTMGIYLYLTRTKLDQRSKISNKLLHLSRHIKRKFYHFIAFFCFAFPSVFYAQSSVLCLITSFALGVCMSIFISVDIFMWCVLSRHGSNQWELSKNDKFVVEQSHIYSFANSLCITLSSLLDSRDSPLFPTSHVSLLFGCTAPYLFFSELSFNQMSPSLSLAKSHYSFLPFSSNALSFLVNLKKKTEEEQIFLFTILRLSGAIAVGIGDASAAIVGVLLSRKGIKQEGIKEEDDEKSEKNKMKSQKAEGFNSSYNSAYSKNGCYYHSHKWPGNHRTIEGSISMVLSMEIVVFIIALIICILQRRKEKKKIKNVIIMGFHLSWGNMRMWICTIGTTLAEAYSKMNDNIILPLIYSSLLILSYAF